MPETCVCGKSLRYRIAATFIDMDKMPENKRNQCCYHGDLRFWHDENGEPCDYHGD